MLQGSSLQDLAAKLMHIDANKKDLVIPVNQLKMNDSNDLSLSDGQSFKPSNWTHQQVSSYTEIPKNYYDRLKDENPCLLAKNVNHSFERNNDLMFKEKGKNDRRLLRTIDGHARAFLSSRYRIIDSSDLLTSVLPLMIENNMQVISSELTERRLYLKALSPKLTTEVKKGDVVQYGIIVSTSDVGAGSCKVEPMIYRLACLNGMISPDSTIKKYHIGKDLATTENRINELLSDETKNLNDKAFWSTVIDVVKNSMRQEVFNSVVDRLRIAANEPIKNINPERIVELSTKATGISGDKIKQQIMESLIKGADLSRWGLVNAFTEAAHKTEGIDYETSINLERAGGLILDLNQTEWRNISATA